MNVPREVHNLIVEYLDLPELLFPPAYAEHDTRGEPPGDSFLDSQHIKYYAANVGDDPGSYALLYWSSTCRYYRHLFEARLFRDVTLRTTLTSIDSLEMVAQTPAWSLVKTFSVCNTLAEPAEDEECSRDVEYEEVDTLLSWPDFPLSRLTWLLSSLPPNLESLTLDFPWDWIDHGEDDWMEMSASGDFGRMILAIIRAVARNDFASKVPFTLRLLNLPIGGAFSGLEKDHLLHRMLSCVTDCRISLARWDNTMYWTQNTINGMEQFTKSLGPVYIKHLTKVETLELQANDSCPIGLGPGRYYLGMCQDVFRPCTRIPNFMTRFSCSSR
jgi:hypothetical protein